MVFAVFGTFMSKGNEYLVRTLKKKDVDMTTGSILGHLINFAWPLLLGNLFQQLYNTVDTWVVGKVSSDAFSAVGTVSPIINMLIGTFSGLASGAGVVISQYYGAKQFDKVKKSVHTSIALTAVLSVAFTVIGLCMIPLMLMIMKTPKDSLIYDYQKSYLIIYFAGITGLLVYNMCSAILRAVGDSVRPFYFLVVSAVLNVALDLLLGLKLDMGVRGVAYATIISQGVSAILSLILLIKTDSCVKLTVKDIRFDLLMIKKIVKVGIPASMQMAVTAFSNVFVQSYINVLGPGSMGGWTAYIKIDQFIFLPMQSLSFAATTFVGQNLGINDINRAKKGVRQAVLIAMAFTALVSVAVIIFAPELVGFFNKDADILRYGTKFLRFITPWYVLCCINQVYSAALRGAGNSRAPMIIMLMSFVAFRQVYLFIMSNFISNTAIPIAYGYPAGWLVCSIATLIYYKCTSLAKTKIV